MKGTRHEFKSKIWLIVILCFLATNLLFRRILLTGNYIVSSSYDKTARAWHFNTDDLATGQEADALFRTFVGHTKGVYPMVFIPNEDGMNLDDSMDISGSSDVLITGSADGTARSWSFMTGNCTKIFKGHNGAITTMSTDANGKILYTASADATIKSWNISSGQILKVTVFFEEILPEANCSLDPSWSYANDPRHGLG